jgi:hypothetical protein
MLHMANGSDLDERFGPPMTINILDIGLPGVRPPAHIQREVMNDIMDQLTAQMRKALDEKPGWEGASDAHRLHIRALDLLLQYALGHPEWDEPGFDLLWPVIEEHRAHFRRVMRLCRRIMVFQYLRAPEEKGEEYREALRKIEAHPNYDPVQWKEDFAAGKYRFETGKWPVDSVHSRPRH